MSRKEHEATKRPYTLISDEFSQSLITLQNDLEESNLYDDEILRKAVLGKVVPEALLEQVELRTLMLRLPEVYSRSIFSSYVASRYIYQYGVHASSVDVYHFISSLQA